MMRITIIIIFVMSFVPLASMRAQSIGAGGFEEQKKQLNEQIRRNTEEIRISTELLDKTQKDQKVSQSQLKIIQSRINSRQNILGDLEKQLNLIGGDISKKRRRVDELGRELDALKRDYAGMVYAAYKNYKLNNFLLFLFSASDFNDATKRVDFMRRYNRLRAEKAKRIAAYSDSVSMQVRQLDATRLELADTRETHNRELASLNKDQTQYKKTVSQLTSQEKQLKKSVADKQAALAKAQRELQAIIDAEVARARRTPTTAAEDARIAALSGRFDQNRGKMPYPIRGGVIIDRFGQHAHQLEKDIKVNNHGVNIAGTGGAEVICVFEGAVVQVFPVPTYNTCIMVNHGNYITVYANLVSVNVKKGDSVSLGQVLGRINNSADEDNNFLHFEIHNQSGPLNPEQWLRR